MFLSSYYCCIYFSFEKFVYYISLASFKCQGEDQDSSLGKCLISRATANLLCLALDNGFNPIINKPPPNLIKHIK